jgi:ATP-dependent RNA helicase DDX10/DBP4
MRSIHLQKNKNVFDVHQLPADEYAESLGLVGAPNIKFKEKNSKNKSRQLENLDNKPLKLTNPKQKLQSKDDSSEEDPTELIQKKSKTKIEKLFNQKNSSVLSEHYTKLVKHEDSDQDDFLKLTREDHDVSGDEQVLKKPGRKATKLKKRLIEFGTGNRIVFNDDGEQRPAYELQPVESLVNVGEDQVEFYRKGMEDMKDVDQLDKENEKQRRREEKRERKLKEKAIRREESGPVGQVTLKAADDNDGEVMTGSDYDSGKDYDLMSGSDYDSGKEYVSDVSDAESVEKMGLKRKNADLKKPNKKTKLDYMDQGSLEEMALGLLQ